MPKHHHGFKNANGAVVAPTIDQSNATTWGASWSTSSAYKIANANGYEDKGNDQAHENMPPYRTIYMWIRTA